MGLTEPIGLIAGALTTIAFVPQVLRTWRAGAAHHFSLGMLVLFTTGLAAWTVYGVLLRSPAVILANAATLVLAGYLLVVKLRAG